MKWKAFGAFAGILLAGCATDYQELDYDKGGYDSKRLLEDTFEVGFFGNAFTEPDKVDDFAMLRAAELTIEHQFTHFEILSRDRQVTSSNIEMPDTASTYGRASLYGNTATYTGTTIVSDNDIPILRAQAKLTIRCYVGNPGGHIAKLYDAAPIIAELRGKRKI
jgi:hypothetical protein